jgi:hypothetical protein
MTNDELQKMLELVAQRQEVFADNMDKAEKRMNQLERGFVTASNLVNETAKIQRELALINVVEKFISEGRNGRAS